MRKLFFPFFIALLSLTVTACSTVLENIPGVYTLEIQQGNMLDQDMIDQLRPNMSKRQVLYIMGSPMLVDAFHQKRWDYLYSKQAIGGAREQKRVSLYFEGDTLTGIQGDFRPDSQAVKTVKETSVDVPARDLEKTLSEMIMGLFSDEPTRKIVVDKPDNAQKSATAPAATEQNSDDKENTEDSKETKPVNTAPVAK